MLMHSFADSPTHILSSAPMVASQDALTSSPTDFAVPMTPNIARHILSSDQCVPHTPLRPATLGIPTTPTSTVLAVGTPHPDSVQTYRSPVLNTYQVEDYSTCASNVDQQVPSTPQSSGARPKKKISDNRGSSPSPRHIHPRGSSGFLLDATNDTSPVRISQQSGSRCTTGSHTSRRRLSLNRGDSLRRTAHQNQAALRSAEITVPSSHEVETMSESTYDCLTSLPRARSLDFGTEEIPMPQMSACIPTSSEEASGEAAPILPAASFPSPSPPIAPAALTSLSYPSPELLPARTREEITRMRRQTPVVRSIESSPARDQIAMLQNVDELDLFDDDEIFG